MNKFLVCGFVVVLALAIVACAETPTPTSVPLPTQSPVQPTATRVPPTATAVPPSPTVVPPTPVRPTVAPPTTVPPSPAPTNTALPPGVYVSNVSISPDRPAFNQDVRFTATFLNSASGDQNLRWAVYIFKADAAAKSNNETSVQVTTFAPGSRDYNALGSFRYGPTGRTCEYFFVRVGLTNAENKIVWVNDPTGKTYEKGFQVCDALTIPTLPPSPPGATAVVPTPRPGLFVTDLRIQPAAQRGVDLTFFPTFANTLGTQMSFTWRVLIYRAENRANSYSETSWLFTHFPVNPGEVRSLGSWKLSLGGPCENFFARVGWLDVNNQTQFFMRPDGTVFERSFAVCPP